MGRKYTSRGDEGDKKVSENERKKEREGERMREMHP